MTSAALLAPLAPLGDVMAAAAAARDRAFGKTVTYSRKVFLPVTRYCRNLCGYCSFSRPRVGEPPLLAPEAALAIAREGEKAHCREALLTLGERPELRYPEVREALARLGHSSTIEYLVRLCRLLIRETTLIPHVNAGTLLEEELEQLAPVVGSLGMMLENVSPRLGEPGGPHHCAPDKNPARRLATLEAAGRAHVPFTTGILIGIGETWEERIESLRAIAASHARHGMIQEVIVQNFRPASDTSMAARCAPGREEMLRTIAAARLILPEEIALQAPPNLAEGDYGAYLDAGINDWGGISPVTADHINPDHPWPAIRELASVTRARGFELKERLTLYPRFVSGAPVRDARRRLDPRLRERIEALAGEDGLPRESLVTSSRVA